MTAKIIAEAELLRSFRKELGLIGPGSFHFSFLLFRLQRPGLSFWVDPRPVLLEFVPLAYADRITGHEIHFTWLVWCGILSVHNRGKEFW